MAYSIDPIQDNCYPGTTVLVNKLHIHDEAALQEAEALATYVNVSKLEHSREPAPGIPCAGSFVEGRSRVMRMIRDSGRTNIVHTIAKKSNTFTNSGLSASFTPHIRRSAGCRCAAAPLPPRPLRRRCRR